MIRVKQNRIQGPQPFPQIGPFRIGVMEKIAVAAVVGAAGAGQADFPGHGGIPFFHGLVKSGQIF